MTTDERYAKAFRERFPGREELSTDAFLHALLSVPGVTPEGAEQLLEFLHSELHPPVGLLRPDDAVDQILRSVPERGLLTLRVRSASAGDVGWILWDEATKRLIALGLFADEVVLRTLGDFALLWSGTPQLMIAGIDRTGRIDLDLLTTWTDGVVDLFFEDGHAVRAKLLLVEMELPEIIYDILEVLSPGPAKYRGVAPGSGSAAAADPRELIQAVRRG